MQTTQPRSLERVRILLVAAVLALAVTATVAARGAAQTASTVTVIGRGELFAEPDQAAITVGVQLYDVSAQAASAELRDRMDAVIAAVRALGIPDRQIQTMNYSIFFERDYQTPPTLRDQDGRPAGIYRVENMVRIVISDVARAAAVVEAAIGAGANQMYGIEFSFSDPGSLDAQARALAMADAAARAQELAAATGRRTGAVREITEVIGTTPGMFDARVMGAGGGPIQPGSTRYAASVQVTYELE